MPAKLTAADKGFASSRAWRLAGPALVIGAYFVLLAPIAYVVFTCWSALPTRQPRRRAQRLQAIMRWAFGSMHRILHQLRILDFQPPDLEDAIPRGPCVLVANHPTLTDTSAMIATVPRIVSPVKPSLFRARWARSLLGAADYFEGAARDSPLTIHRVIETAVERLDQGYRLMVFPEGTRSPAGGGLHPFGRMPFEVAVRKRVPIVPLVITCEPRWLSREKSFFDYIDAVPRLRIRALPAVPPEDSSSRTLRDIVQGRIEAALSGTAPSEAVPKAIDART